MTPVLLSSVILASLIGSPHCAGMCGPFVMLACGSRGDSRRMSLTGYHAGRLTTYLVLGAIAGQAGQTITRTGAWLGVSQLATMIAGIGMLLAGVIAILRLRGIVLPHPRLPSGVSYAIQGVFRTTSRWPTVARAFAVGLATTWLPCGWLYAFVLVAAGAGSMAGAIGVMTAFWIGTLPMLSVVAWGATLAGTRWRAAVPWVSAVVMIAAGAHLLTTRAHADLATLNRATVPSDSVAERLEQARTTRPPCCHAR